MVAYFKPNEVLLMAILLGTIVSRFIIQAFAESALMFYIGAFVFVFGSYSMSIEKSLLTQCVSENELGKIFAVNAALENFGPLGASQVYASVWSVSICSYTVSGASSPPRQPRQLPWLIFENIID